MGSCAHSQHQNEEFHAFTDRSSTHSSTKLPPRRSYPLIACTEVEGFRVGNQQPWAVGFVRPNTVSWCALVTFVTAWNHLSIAPNLSRAASGSFATISWYLFTAHLKAQEHNSCWNSIVAIPSPRRTPSTSPRILCPHSRFITHPAIVSFRSFSVSSIPANQSRAILSQPKALH